jgi:hypothetical protein
MLNLLISLINFLQTRFEAEVTKYENKAVAAANAAAAATKAKEDHFMNALKARSIVEKLKSIL